jgi:hypothetical protein
MEPTLLSGNSCDIYARSYPEVSHLLLGKLLFMLHPGLYRMDTRA